MPTVAQMRARLETAGYKAEWWTEQKSPSGKGLHIIITLDRPTSSPTETVALQAILGSDPMREAYNLTRVRNLSSVPEWWRSRWNVLYHQSEG